MIVRAEADQGRENSKRWDGGVGGGADCLGPCVKFGIYFEMGAFGGLSADV